MIENNDSFLTMLAKGIESALGKAITMPLTIPIKL